MRSLRFTSSSALVGILAAGASLIAAAPAHAADPILRHQQDVRGDVVTIGSTMGFDCAAGAPAALSGTPSCNDVTFANDSAPDIYWRDDTANTGITALQARTSATLSLPAGAKISYARLYWAALKDDPTQPYDAFSVPPVLPEIDYSLFKADSTVVLDRKDGPSLNVVADNTWVTPYALASHLNWFYYQASADVTSFVRLRGAGTFRVSDIDALALSSLGRDEHRAFSAWTLVVFYEKDDADLRNLTLFDGLINIDPQYGQPSAEVTLSGFVIPPSHKANFMVFGYEGDSGTNVTAEDSDYFSFHNDKVTSGSNPIDDFFNASRTFLGSPISFASDVPRLSGAPGSMGGYDLDTVDVSGILSAGATSVKVAAGSTHDVFLLGGFATSIMSLAPDFNGFAKSAVDLNGGSVVTGDVLRFTLEAKNTGNDSAINARITDVLEPGFTLVPGSIKVNGAARTDAVGDDTAEYVSSSRTIVARVGSGANATAGGKIAPNETVTVTFDVTVTATEGTLSNQAKIVAAGEGGLPDKTWDSDGDPTTVDDEPTIVTIDECDTDAQCEGATPHCDPVTHVCSACVTDADCTDPALPACQPSGACGECSKTNDTLCTGDTPACETDAGVCVLCTPGADGDATQCATDPNGPVCIPPAGASEIHCGCSTDSDCGATDSGKVCDTVPEVCVDGCRGEGGNGCPEGLECTSKTSEIGQCVPSTSGAGGAGGGTNGNLNDDVVDPGDTGGCACSVPSASSPLDVGAPIAGALGLLALASRRRRR